MRSLLERWNIKFFILCSLCFLLFANDAFGRWGRRRSSKKTRFSKKTKKLCTDTGGELKWTRRKGDVCSCPTKTKWDSKKGCKKEEDKSCSARVTDTRGKSTLYKIPSGLEAKNKQKCIDKYTDPKKYECGVRFARRRDFSAIIIKWHGKKVFSKDCKKESASKKEAGKSIKDTPKKEAGKSAKDTPIEEIGFNSKKKYTECDVLRGVDHFRICSKVTGNCKSPKKCPSGKCAKRGKGGACAPLEKEDTSPVKFCQYAKNGLASWSECAHKAANGNSCKKWKNKWCEGGTCVDKISDSPKLGWKKLKPGIYKKCGEPEPNMAKFNKCSKGKLSVCTIAPKGGKCLQYEQTQCGSSKNPGCCKDSKSCLYPAHPKCPRGKPNCCIGGGPNGSGTKYWMQCKKPMSEECPCGCRGSGCLPPKIDVDPEVDSDRGEDYIKGYECGDTKYRK